MTQMLKTWLELNWEQERCVIWGQVVPGLTGFGSNSPAMLASNGHVSWIATVMRASQQQPCVPAKCYSPPVHSLVT
jgi:hypothetical protein